MSRSPLCHKMKILSSNRITFSKLFAKLRPGGVLKELSRGARLLKMLTQNFNYSYKYFCLFTRFFHICALGSSASLGTVPSLPMGLIRHWHTVTSKHCSCLTITDTRIISITFSLENLILRRFWLNFFTKNAISKKQSKQWKTLLIASLQNVCVAAVGGGGWGLFRDN